MRILSGIRPSGGLHLGNYVGAVKQWIELQSAHEAFFMVADLHAITTPYEPRTLRTQIRQTVADYLAAGLDPQRSPIFVQSTVPAHTELMWVLASLTTIGELQRMTQYKDKVAEGAPANAGLFTYPVLMAADILLYRADGVPVGEDQIQHVEFARTMARKFNRDFGKVFPEPKAILTEGKRIMSLRDPSTKMSKTGGDGIGLADSPEEIKRKVAKAVTATAGGGKNPGVENLFVLLRTFSTPKVVGDYADAEKKGTIRYADLKAQLAKDIAEHFVDFRKRRASLLKDPATIDDVLADGTKRARVVAEATLAEVYKKAGLRS